MPAPASRRITGVFAIQPHIRAEQAATPPIPAGSREAGARCPHCHVEIRLAQSVVSCRACGTVHHETCWGGCQGCGSYACSPSRREVEDAPGDRLVISDEEIREATPLVSKRPVGSTFVSKGGPPETPKMSRLAVASLITAVAGIPLVGVVTGLVAILLAALALGRIQARMARGLGIAVGGMVLGLADVVGWAIFLAYALNSAPLELIAEEGNEPTLNRDDVSPKIYGAMQANVLIQRRAGWAGMATGSGVILQVDDGTALIVTNRHIADPNFPGQTAPPDLDAVNTGKLTVRLLNGPARPGVVTWIAPDGVDLALVKIAIKPEEAAVARWAPDRPMRVGDPVFAIGNPQMLNWTHTTGVISQFRNLTFGGRAIRVIQTQTAINPGNSGGGLYDDAANLIGINTWTRDKRSSEGLSFSITFDALLALKPPGLTIPLPLPPTLPNPAPATPPPKQETAP